MVHGNIRIVSLVISNSTFLVCKSKPQLGISIYPIGFHSPRKQWKFFSRPGVLSADSLLVGGDILLHKFQSNLAFTSISSQALSGQTQLLGASSGNNTGRPVGGSDSRFVPENKSHTTSVLESNVARVKQVTIVGEEGAECTLDRIHKQDTDTFCVRIRPWPVKPPTHDAVAHTTAWECGSAWHNYVEADDVSANPDSGLLVWGWRIFSMR
jgi:hypothetical protein